MLRDLRRIAEGAKADLREGLGPEFQDFDFDDLNPKTFVRKHLFDEAEQQALFDQFSSTTAAATGVMAPAIAGEANASGNGNGSTAVLRDGEQPPFDFEAT